MKRVHSDQRMGRRNTQEDTVQVLGDSETDPEAELLLLLADGMGGHAGGDVASQLAVSAFAEHFQNVSENMHPRGRLKEAILAANEAIGDRVSEAPELHGMGSTFIGALVAQGRLVWASVGDSLLLLVRNSEIHRLNEDHSVFGDLLKMVERGELTREEAKAHPRRNALRSALTGEPVDLIDINAMELAPSDVILVASDGLETLELEDILRITEAQMAHGSPAIVNALLDAVDARDRPKQDNTTLIAVCQAGEKPAASLPGTSTKSGTTPATRQPALGFAGLSDRGLFWPIAGLMGLVLILGLAVGWLLRPGSSAQPAAADPNSEALPPVATPQPTPPSGGISEAKPNETEEETGGGNDTGASSPGTDPVLPEPRDEEAIDTETTEEPQAPGEPEANPPEQAERPVGGQ